MPRENSGYMLPPPGTTDASSVVTGTGKNAGREIKEWQAIMDYLRTLPANPGKLPVIPVMRGWSRCGRSRRGERF